MRTLPSNHDLKKQIRVVHEIGLSESAQLEGMRNVCRDGGQRSRGFAEDLQGANHVHLFDSLSSPAHPNATQMPHGSSVLSSCQGAGLFRHHATASWTYLFRMDKILSIATEIGSPLKVD